jgi:hypothetical protein
VLQYVLKIDGLGQIFDAMNAKKEKKMCNSDLPHQEFHRGNSMKLTETGSQGSSKDQVTFSGNIKD